MFAVQLGDGLAHRVNGSLTLCRRSVDGGDPVKKKEWGHLMSSYAASFPDMELVEQIPICLACAPRDYRRWRGKCE